MRTISALSALAPKTECGIQTLPGAGSGDGNLAPAAKVHAVLFKDAYGDGRLDGDLACGAIYSGGRRASHHEGNGKEVGDRSQRACAWTTT
jgi:hypothetical protein